MEYLKRSILFAFLFMFFMLILNVSAFRENGWQDAVCNAALIPLISFLKGIGLPETLGFLLICILLLPLYYFLMGLFGGALVLAAVETIRSKIADIRYSKEDWEDVDDIDLE